MIQRPYSQANSAKTIGAITTPVNPSNLQAAVGSDLFFPPGSTSTLLVYPSASPTAVTQGATSAPGSASAVDTGLQVTAIVNDSNGNPWYQCIDTQGGVSGYPSTPATVYVPASSASVPIADQQGTDTNLIATIQQGQSTSSSTGPTSQTSTSTSVAPPAATGTGQGGGGIGWWSQTGNFGPFTNGMGFSLIALLVIGTIVVVASNND